MILSGKSATFRDHALGDFDLADGDLAAARIVLGVESDLLALAQAVDAGALQCGGMDENVLLAVIRLDETEALLVVVELHGARKHENILFGDVCTRELAHEVSCPWSRVRRSWRESLKRARRRSGEAAQLSGQI